MRHVRHGMASTIFRWACIATFLILATIRQVQAVTSLKVYGSSIVFWMPLTQTAKITGCNVENCGQVGYFFVGHFCRIYKEVVGAQAPDIVVLVFRNNSLTFNELKIYGPNNKYKNAYDECIGDDAVLKKIVYDKVYNRIDRSQEVSFPECLKWDHGSDLTPSTWDFEGRFDMSLLPDLVSRIEDSNKKLILVRWQGYKFAANPGGETDEMKKYAEDLTAYCNSKSIHFIDFAHCTELTTSDYRIDPDGEIDCDDHIADGSLDKMDAFLGANLKSVVNGKLAKYERTDPSLFDNGAVRAVSRSRATSSALRIHGAHGGFTVEGLAGARRVRIVNPAGKVVQDVAADRRRVSVTGLTPGCYVVRVGAGPMRKVVVSH